MVQYYDFNNKAGIETGKKSGKDLRAIYEHLEEVLKIIYKALWYPGGKKAMLGRIQDVEKGLEEPTKTTHPVLWWTVLVLLVMVMCVCFGLLVAILTLQESNNTTEV